MAQVQRYHSTVIILHWVMALCFILMLASGLFFQFDLIADKSLKFKMYQWHKSLGVLLMFALVLRVAARLMFKAPKLPNKIPKKDQVLSKLGHLAMYGFMIAMPVTGWVMVSSSPYGLPTVVFDMFTWPHIPGLASDTEINSLSKFGHKWLGWAFIALIILHVAAVVVHLKKEKINLLKRMSFRG